MISNQWLSVKTGTMPLYHCAIVLQWDGAIIYLHWHVGRYGHVCVQHRGLPRREVPGEESVVWTFARFANFCWDMAHGLFRFSGNINKFFKAFAIYCTGCPFSN